MATIERQSSDRTQRQQHDSRRGLNSLSSTCFIRPKTTGLVSLFIQVVLIIISGITSLFFFYHVGGYEYTHWNENSTILEPIRHNTPSYKLSEKEVISNPESYSSIVADNSKDSLVSTADREINFLNENDKDDNETDSSFVFNFFDSSPHPDAMIENASFGIEQVPLTTVQFGDVVFDWLEVIRISTIVYIALCIIWVMSGLLFICTIRCEVLDTAIINTTVLILVVLFQCAHAGLITSLLFYQREMSWRTMSITVGSIVIIFCCAFLGFICILLNCGWVRYIDYMHGGKKFTICSLVESCTRQKTTPENKYTENGQNSTNDIPMNNFDAF